MSRPERPRAIRFTQGPTTVEVEPEGVRVATRGINFGFANLDDFIAFLTELGIIAVQIDQALPERNRGQSGHTDDEENPT